MLRMTSTVLKEKNLQLKVDVSTDLVTLMPSMAVFPQWMAPLKGYGD